MKIQLYSPIGKWTAIWDRQKRKTVLSKWDGGSIDFCFKDTLRDSTRGQSWDLVTIKLWISIEVGNTKSVYCYFEDFIDLNQ